MIDLKQPSLVLNAHDAPGYTFSMWATWKMPANMAVRDVVYWIAYACDQAPELALKHVVINTHGYDGHVIVGQTAPRQYITINNYNVGLFNELRKKEIGTIWFTACELAKSGVGRYMCAQLAKAAGCDVVAADVIQEAWNSVVGTIFMSYGAIDDFEGKVYRWSATGKEEVFYPNGKSF